MITEHKTAKPQPRQQALLHRRDAEFTEIGVFVDQRLFTLRPRRLSGELSEFLLETWFLNASLDYSATPLLQRSPVLQRFELLERVERLEQFLITTSPAVT